MWKSGLVVAVLAWLLYKYGSSVGPDQKVIQFGLEKGAGPAVPRPSDLTAEEKADYARDGFLLKKRIVQGEELQELVTAGEKLYASNAFMDIFFKAAFAKLAMQVWRQNGAFLRFAFESSFPSMTAELTGETESIRILKDGFFGFKGKSNSGCGFHVDDKGFWPADDASTGVNFWLALSPMRIAQGGGIRVVNQSLTTEFAQECRDVIRLGQGYNATCQMESLSPTCHERLLAASVVYDMDPGDVLIWDRWTFHRSEPFLVETDEHKLRYTIRYVPGNARAEGMVHESVAQGELLKGPFYPQVWPAALPGEVSAIREGLEDDFVVSFGVMKRLIVRSLSGMFKKSDP